MRQLLIAAAMAGTVLAAMPPAEAKSVWIKCRYQEISLDSEKERYSLIFIDKIYQGPAFFSPERIEFEYITTEPVGQTGVKLAWTIDRKTLNYTRRGMSRYVIPGVADTGWKIEAYPGNTQTGKCSIMKTPPTAGNQI